MRFDDAKTYTLSEVAWALGAYSTSLERLIRQGKLRGSWDKPADSYRLKGQEVNRFLAEVLPTLPPEELRRP
ncbi:MAG: hypothetical protein HY335_08680 [Deinococcus sp.]|nr:hypothetical protein [Deinococcus sp.]